MAKGVGLDAGEFEVKVVELDGSYRKPRLTKVSVDRVRAHAAQASDPDHADSEAQALRQALKAAHVGKQNVTLGFPSREALFRQMMVPFTGHERIRKVIKFEAEGEIHSQSVDDMVIDFHIVEEQEEETRVLVAGLPKSSLRLTLDSLASAGIEPEQVDLDCMGLFRVATWAGAFGEAAQDAAEQDEDEDESESAELQPPSGGDAASRVVLCVGARSTLVLVVTGGHLTDMRAVPLGCDSITEELASRFDIGMDEAREAVAYCLESGQDLDVSRLAADGDDEEGESEGQGEADDETDGETVAPVAQIVVDASSVQDARDRFLKRLRREFMRFMVSVRGMERTSAAFVCGGGAALPGLDPMLADVFGCEPQALRIMHMLNHNLDEEEAEELEPRIAVAVGLALGSLSGVKGFNFRQEELAYTRGFDRIKLPLALACMLLLFFMFFHGVGLRNELKAKKQVYGTPDFKKTTAGAKRRQVGGKVSNYAQYGGYLGFLVNERTWPEQNLPHNEYRKMLNDMAKEPTFGRMNWYKSRLRSILKDVQKRGQYDPKLTLDSATAVAQQFAEVVKTVEKRLGVFYIGSLSMRLPPKGNRSFGFKVFFRGDNFRSRNATLQDAFEAEFRKKDSAFDKFTKTATENPVSGDSGTGCYYDYSLTLRPSVPVRKL